jgi:DedD protein
MARSISDEELQLKKRARRRLVGAIALVTLVVIFLPMVLESEPKPVGQDIAIRIPSQESGDFAARHAPAVPKPAAPVPVETAPAKQSSPVPAIAQSTPAPAVAAQKDAEAPTPDKPAAGPASPAPPQKVTQKAENGSHSQFVVLLGAFSNMANAKQRQAKLAALGIKFYSETVKTATGEKLRVRAGPYATRQEAEQVRDMLKGKGVQDGMVAEK